MLTLLQILWHLPEILAAMAAQLNRIETLLKEIKVTEQETINLLHNIDNTTNHIADNVATTAANVQVISGTAKNISDEVDALLAQIADLKKGTVPQSVVDALTALGTKADAMATASDAATGALTAQVDVLKQIASKGTPTVPAPPPPVPPAPSVP